MKRTMLIGGAMCVATALFSFDSNADGIKEGQWSMTMTVQMDGAMGQEMARAQKDMENMSPQEKAMMQQMMGNMGMQMGAANGGGMTISRKQCLTNANPVPKKEDQENCQETHTMAGNTVKFEVNCKDSRSSGEVTYDNDSMKGTIQSNQSKIDITGQYEGPCNEK